MGNTGSRSYSGVEDPFPIDARTSKDLDKLSMVAARILSTPDIYDINNLKEPGVCGKYVVMLRKNIEKKLLPFVAEADIGGRGVKERVEVGYQDTKKLFKNEEARKAVCTSMTNTMLRTVATVVACLASIQIAGPSREAAVAFAGATSQRGGAMSEVYTWLLQNGYVSTTSPNPVLPEGRSTGRPVSMLIKGGELARSGYNVSITLVMAEMRGVASNGYLQIAGTAGQAELPRDYLRIQFLDPIIEPTRQIAVLPVRIVDRTGVPWLAGMLLPSGGVFKSFHQASPPQVFTDVIYSLFRRLQGYVQGFQFERHVDTNAAAAVYQDLKRAPNYQYIEAALPGFLQSLPEQQRPPYGQPQAPVYGQQRPLIYGQQPAVVAPYRAQTYALPGAVYQPAYRPIGPAPTAFYHIPPNSGNAILKYMSFFTRIIPKESSPAAVRANTLRGVLDAKTRTIYPGFCNDPYWSTSAKPTAKLDDVYPWLTFQFLSIVDWGSLGGDISRVSMESEFTTFVDRLVGLYNGDNAPKLEIPQGGSRMLDKLSIKNVEKLKLCETNKPPHVRFQEVQAAARGLQELYAAHVKKMWDILNSLIYVIVDPETNVEMVRLNENVVSGPTTSEAYVNGKAKEARTALAEFYYRVEELYLNAIRGLVPV